MQEYFSPLQMAESKRAYQRFRYTIEELKNAIIAVQEKKMSTNQASKHFNIPKGTLINKLHGKSSIEMRKIGPSIILLPEEEDRLEDWILQKAKIGFPMHPDEVKDVVQAVMQETNRENPFQDNRPGEKWLKLFLKRKPAIQKRNAEIISKARACVTEQSIRQWFSELYNYVKGEDALDILEDGDRIYNADETGVQLCPKTGKLLGPKHFKNFYDIAVGKEKECITVLATFSASGRIAPPCIVFPYKRIPRDVANSVPDNYNIGRSDTGWMTGPTFYEYVVNNFYKWLTENGIKFPILFLLDGHKSHINPQLAQFCREKQIFLYCLLPNATHILQPCDVGIFRPLKVAWKNQCRKYKQQTRKILTKATFAPVFAEAFLHACKKETIQNSFRACGIFPFNEENVDYSKCMSNRQKEDKLDNIQDVNARDFLNTLEKEMSPSTLNKYKNAEEMNNELAQDKLFTIWKKYSDILKKCDSHIDLEELNFPKGAPVCEENSGNEVVIGNINDFSIALNTEGHPVTGEDDNIFVLLSTNSDTQTKDEHTVEATNENLTTQAMVDVHNYIDSLSNETEDIANTTSEMIPGEIQEKTCLERESESASISNTTLKKKLNKDIWEKHLHFPNIEASVRKRKTENVPLAVSSKLWKEYHEQKETEKKTLEDVRNQRKLLRMEKQRKITVIKSIRRNKMRIKKSTAVNIERSEDALLNSNVTSTEDENETSRTESFVEFVEPTPNQSVDINFGVADFVIAQYENQYFPGIIITARNHEYEVRVMSKSGPQSWKWPNPIDQIWYKKENILEKIEPPQVLCSRGNTYSVPEMTKYNSLL